MKKEIRPTTRYGTRINREMITKAETLIPGHIYIVKGLKAGPWVTINNGKSWRRT